jgi:ribose transport system permease protein
VIRTLRREGWVVGLALLFVALMVATMAIQPGYGGGDFGSLARAALPYAFATAAQAVVVIGGGIDLSIASMMALTSVTAARAMEGASEEAALVIVPLVLLMGAALGALNGILIVVTRVPDIVVTLATLFVFQGAALLVLEAPGGGAALWLRGLIDGTVAIPGVPDAVVAWIPKALVLLVVCLAVVWIPLKRSQLGLSIYAIGSSELAAFRSGVPVAKTKIAAYAIAGLFAAMGGLSLTMATGIGAPIPGPYLLASVAAVVLGGVVLGGGRGTVLAAMAGALTLEALFTLLNLYGVSGALEDTVQGIIIIAAVAFASYRLRGAR